MDKNREYSVYFLKDPYSDEIRYVGLSYNVEKRFKEHLKDNNDSYKKRWINNLLVNQIEPQVEVVKSGMSLSEAFELEMFYIKHLKENGVRLTNETVGGEAPMANKTHTEDTKIKMSKNRTGKNNSFYGKSHSELTINKIRESLKGRVVWNKGKKLSSEHIKKLKISKVGHVPHNKNKTRFDLSLMECLLNQNLSQSEVAKIFNTDQGTISRYIKKHKLKINK